MNAHRVVVAPPEVDRDVTGTQHDGGEDLPTARRYHEPSTHEVRECCGSEEDVETGEPEPEGGRRGDIRFEEKRLGTCEHASLECAEGANDAGSSPSNDELSLGGPCLTTAVVSASQDLASPAPRRPSSCSAPR